jgi:hypothetical protein
MTPLVSRNHHLLHQSLDKLRWQGLVPNPRNKDTHRRQYKISEYGLLPSSACRPCARNIILWIVGPWNWGEVHIPTLYLLHHALVTNWCYRPSLAKILIPSPTTCTTIYTDPFSHTTPTPSAQITLLYSYLFLERLHSVSRFFVI